MRSHSLGLLGLDLHFKSDAEPERIECARLLIEERYSRLSRHGGTISKEKLLAFIALSLADDIIQLRDEKQEIDDKLREFLGNIEKVAG
jgi:cell division protein ZapA